MGGNFCEFVYLWVRRIFESLWSCFCKMLRWFVTWCGYRCPYGAMWIWFCKILFEILTWFGCSCPYWAMWVWHSSIAGGMCTPSISVHEPRLLEDGWNSVSPFIPWKEHNVNVHTHVTSSFLRELTLWRTWKKELKYLQQPSSDVRCRLNMSFSRRT